MKIIKIKEIEAKENPHNVEAKLVYDDEKAQIIHLTLKPGERLKRHVTPVDVVFYVLEGSGIVEIGDEKRLVEKDVAIESPAKIPHCWYNESNGVLRVLVIKLPRPNEPTKIL
ncbi:Mannose-6-phosphate isomerase [Archaeoglobus sulfaticallidus PM70-1]|uniref:Mannose-6-phosphate isomerase n=1 Tax=Archaeoglobus sulfaticallidus PM70-1 TaxID=387631 RepID=N0BNS7_9EURY|nr:cupin domain-containing protein [Archaeoglobus sulfaticallidus]AGK61985.1 Mannose-6-phosphate isomerase [Archaeoglobus sulfaticallidus PM70-1]